MRSSDQKDVPVFTGFPAAQVLNTLMDTVSDGAFVLSLSSDDYTLVHMNRLLAHMLSDDVRLGPVSEALPHKTAQWIKRRVHKVLDAAHPQTFQVTTDVFQGGQHHVKVRLSPVFGASGQPTHVVGVVQVLTETIKAQAEARQQRDRFGLAMEYAPFGVCFVGADLKPVMVNRTLAFWLDQPYAALKEREISDFVHPDDRAMLAQALRKVLQGGRTYRAIEVRVVPTAGAEDVMWVSVNMSRVAEQGAPYVVMQMTDITLRKGHEEELVRQATRDHLTGLANRKVFEDALKRALKKSRRYSRGGAILYIDLNNFKYVNDNFGHKAGDAILKQTSSVLENLLRETDVVARVGGDEFAAIMHEVPEHQARDKARQIEGAIAHTSVQAHGKEVRVGASVGVHMFDGSEMGMTMDDMIAAADHDMYANKAASKARMRIVS